MWKAGEDKSKYEFCRKSCLPFITYSEGKLKGNTSLDSTKLIIVNKIKKSTILYREIVEKKLHSNQILPKN